MKVVDSISFRKKTLFGCVPVGSAVNGIPDIIGNKGLVIPRRNADLIEKAIRKAMVSDSGEKARGRAVNHYSISTRYEKLTGFFVN